MSLDLPEVPVYYWDGRRYQRADPAPLVAQAESLLRLPEPEFSQALKAFNASVDGHVTGHDKDFGALVLEALADACTDAGRKQDLYASAVNRAQMFASYASSGGEGLARSIDVKRIADKLDRLGFELTGGGDDTVEEFRGYEQMRASGKSAREVGVCAAADGLDRIEVIRVLRHVFDLSLDEAVEVVDESG